MAKSTLSEENQTLNFLPCSLDLFCPLFNCIAAAYGSRCRVVGPTPDYGERFGTVMWLWTRAERDESPGEQQDKAKVNPLVRAPASARGDRCQKNANDGELNTG